MISEIPYKEWFEKYTLRFWPKEVERDPLFWLWFVAQCKAESNFKPNAVSNVGAVGLMQFMPATWEDAKKQLGFDGDRTDSELSIMAGIWYDKICYNFLSNHSEYLQWPDWNKFLAMFASYNWGMGRVGKIVDKLGSRFESFLDYPKPEETQNYIERITLYHTNYYETAKGNGL